MTVEEAGRRWGYGPNQVKRLKALCLSLPERFPLVAGHVTIPDDSYKIFVPDGRSKNARGYFYRYILDAIGTDSLLYPESIGITAADKRMKMINTMVTELPVLRARIGASQADISERIGISRQTYNAIENGKKKMSWTVFLALYTVFSSDERTLKALDSMVFFQEGIAKEI